MFFVPSTYVSTVSVCAGALVFVQFTVAPHKLQTASLFVLWFRFNFKCNKITDLPISLHLKTHDNIKPYML